MPKGFTDEEKIHLRARLLEQSQQLFETYGLHKTTVEDITRAVGISKGAFYLFYDSKEALFFAVLEHFEEAYRTSLMAFAPDPNKSPRENLWTLLRLALTAWQEHPFFRGFKREEYEMLLRRLPPESIQAHLEDDDTFVAVFMDKWRELGLNIEGDPKEISALMKALFFVGLHKDDFGPEAYPHVLDLLLNMVVGYLLKD